MTPRHADEPPRVDASATPSPKHPFNRDPLLVPKLFVDMKLPWHRQPAVLAGAGLCTIALLGTAAAIRAYSVEGLLRKFAALVSR